MKCDSDSNRSRASFELTNGEGDVVSQIETFQESTMNIRILPAALVLSAFAFAASAQTGGSMSGPATNHMAGQPTQGCTPAQNHMAGGAMSGGAMASGNHMSGGSMSGGAMTGGDHMSGGAMAGGSTGNGHMAAANTGCQPAQKPNP
jgi:hypothetical protein